MLREVQAPPPPGFQVGSGLWPPAFQQPTVSCLPFELEWCVPCSVTWQESSVNIHLQNYVLLRTLLGQSRPCYLVALWLLGMAYGAEMS